MNQETVSAPKKPHVLRYRGSDDDVRLLDELCARRVQLAKLVGREPPPASRSDTIREAVRALHEEVSFDLKLARKRAAEPDWTDVFIEDFRKIGSMDRSARKAGVTIDRVCERKRRDPDFDQRCRRSLVEATEAFLKRQNILYAGIENLDDRMIEAFPADSGS